MEILIEQIDNPRFIVESSTNASKEMFINGIFMQAEIKNRNQRVYPYNEIKRATDHINGIIKENNGLFGELDHPDNLSINPQNISHVILEMRMEGNDAYGKAKLINTPSGLIAQELFKTGVKVGVSSRGAGNVNEGVVSDYIATTIDIVINPSAMGATPTAIMEGVERAKNGNRIMSLSEALVHDDSAQKYFKREILKWLSDSNFAKR